MNSGILLCVCGALSFGLLACASKVAERKNSNSAALVGWVFGWATLAMLGRSLMTAGQAHVTMPVVAIAMVFGVCAAVAYFAFQLSIAVGRVTVGWLMMNLSAGIPAIVSILLYGEKVTLLKSVAFALALVALACLFQGHRIEARHAIAAGTK
jgi:drug/metabolite transporter (DMT)-like permease